MILHEVFVLVLIVCAGDSFAQLSEASYDEDSATIRIEGQGNTLESTALDIKDEKIFRYADGMAFCNATLSIEPGAGLIIGGEKGSAPSEVLRMNCETGQYSLIVKGATKEKPPGRLLVTNSVVAPKDIRSWYRFVVDGYLELRDSEVVGANTLLLRGRSSTRVVGATIESFGHHRHGVALSPLYFQSVKRAEVNGLRVIRGGSSAIHIQCPLTIYNAEVEGGVLVRYSAVWRAVNCSFHRIRIQEYKGASGRVLRYWYLDVYAVDEKGKPVPGAIVKVLNENYPALNCKGEILTETRTCDGKGLTPAGHTPLPSDSPERSLVVFDYAQLSSERKLRYEAEKVTHALIVSREGYRTVRLTFDPDESWYRKDPNKPVKTIEARLRKE